MKVAIVYDLTEAGGVQTCVFSLIKGLNSKNITPVVFWDKEPNKALVNELNLNIGFSSIKFTISSKFIKKFPNIIRYLLWPFNMIKISKIPESFDFVYSFTPNILIDIERPHLFYLSGPPLLPQLESKKKVFLFAKKTYNAIIEPFYPAYLPQIKANYVINSNYTSQMFEEAHGRKLEVVYPSNQLNFKSEIHDYKQKKYSTFFSRIVDYKRPDSILKLAEKFPDQSFIIMGGVSANRINYFNSLKEKADSLRLTNVQFYPNATKQQVEDILLKSRFYIFPAINEHFGITTVEAILKGCIPFVHDSGGQREIVPFDELRFADGEFFEKYNELIKLSEQELENYEKQLKGHMTLFAEDTYIQKMISFIK